MPIGIHDKTPEGRRKLKEGPKAQERYVEELVNEWIDNHASLEPDVPESLHGEEVPQDVKDMYALKELATQMALLEKTEAEIAKLRSVTRVQAIARIAAQDMQLYGHVRDGTYEEMLELGLDPTECGVVPPPDENPDD